jgi:hypothetical protein
MDGQQGGKTRLPGLAEPTVIINKAPAGKFL